MDLAEFVSTHNGQYLDFDGVYGAQCVDLVLFYLRDVCGLPPLPGNAIDEFGENPDRITWIRSDPSNSSQIPPPGAIAIWGQNYRVGTGVLGHTAVVVESNSAGFRSFDQNWPVNAPCHIVAHIYDGVIGWGVPQIQGGSDEMSAADSQGIRFIQFGLFYDENAPDLPDGSKPSVFAKLFHTQIRAELAKVSGTWTPAQQQELDDIRATVHQQIAQTQPDLTPVLAAIADLKANSAVKSDPALAAAVDAIAKHIGVGTP